MLCNVTLCNATVSAKTHLNAFGWDRVNKTCIANVYYDALQRLLFYGKIILLTLNHVRKSTYDRTQSYNMHHFYKYSTFKI